MATKPRSRKAMIDYLANHFRYDTMHSWNQATSYARKIKVHSLGLDRDTESRAYEMLDVQSSFYDFNRILVRFNQRHSNYYQIWGNGRSGGYLVLGQGGQRPSEHKSLCHTCGQRNFTKVEGDGPGQCGLCRAMDRWNAVFPPDVYAQPGKGLDMEGDYADWDTYNLRERVDLVWDFDRTCEKAVQSWIKFVKANVPKKKTIMVPKEITVAEKQKAG